MFVLGPRNSYIDSLGTSLVKLGLRQRHVGLSGNSAREPGLGQRQVLLVLLHRVVEQPLLGVQAAQFKVIRRQLRAQAQIDIRQVSSCGLRSRPLRFHRSADVAPEIRLPGNLPLEEQVVVGGLAAGNIQWTVLRLASREADGPACTVG